MNGGEPAQVVKINEDHSFKLIEANLKMVLLQEHIKDMEVVVVSVAGAFRKGKSFLLNFFIIFLKNLDNYKWMGEENENLKGFHWKSGSERDTTGILIWNQAFVVPGPNNKDVAVILMDTQGAFDSQSTIKEGLTIFTLSTIISSVQVYNIAQNLQENDLQHLQFSSQYGKLAKTSSENKNTDSNSTEIKPFQTLMFLVRDWDYPSECPYGEEGGKMLLDKRLFNVTEKMNKDLKNVRQDIKDCFEKITCFLMPYPGKKVTTNPKYNGKIVDMDTDFREQLSELVPLILAPKNLVIKSINGSVITAKDLFQYFKTYMKKCESGELPEPQSLYEATTEVSYRNEKDKAFENYKNDMNKVCGSDQPYLPPDILKNEHEKYEEEAITKFKEAPKMGRQSISDTFLERLKEEITNYYEDLKKLNKGVKKGVAEKQNTDAVKEALKEYNKLEKEALEQPYLFPESLQSKHTEYMKKANNLFDKKAKGGIELIQPHRNQLENLIKTSYESFPPKVAKEASKEYDELKEKALIVQPYLYPEDLQSEHAEYMGEAIKLFYEKAKGGEELIKLYLEKLENLIETSYKNFQEENYKKADLLDEAANNYMPSVLGSGAIFSFASMVAGFSPNFPFVLGAGAIALILKHYKKNKKKGKIKIKRNGRSRQNRF